LRAYRAGLRKRLQALDEPGFLTMRANNRHFAGVDDVERNKRSPY
jgi:hypothetical protein